MLIFSRHQIHKPLNGVDYIRLLAPDPFLTQGTRAFNSPVLYLCSFFPAVLSLDALKAHREEKYICNQCGLILAYCYVPDTTGGRLVMKSGRGRPKFLELITTWWESGVSESPVPTPSSLSLTVLHRTWNSLASLFNFQWISTLQVVYSLTADSISHGPTQVLDHRKWLLNIMRLSFPTLSSLSWPAPCQMFLSELMSTSFSASSEISKIDRIAYKALSLCFFLQSPMYFKFFSHVSVAILSLGYGARAQLVNTNNNTFGNVFNFWTKTTDGWDVSATFLSTEYFKEPWPSSLLVAIVQMQSH